MANASASFHESDDDQQVIRFELNGNDLELEIEDAQPVSVDLSFLISSGGGTTQNLALNGTDLTISGGNTVDLSALVVDLDQQTLELDGQELSISGGNSVDLSGLVGGQNHFDIFGNPIATN